ncbi:hypothetical protein J6590_106100, partial [Homalodisca vitripennis]
LVEIVSAVLNFIDGCLILPKEVWVQKPSLTLGWSAWYLQLLWSVTRWLRLIGNIQPPTMGHLQGEDCPAVTHPRNSHAR